MNQITKTDVINDIKKVSSKVKTFTREAYRDKGAYSSWLVESRFGNFSKAVRASKIKNVATR